MHDQYFLQVQARGLVVDRQHDVRFYPDDDTIRRHCRAATRKAQLHHTDQEAVQWLVGNLSQRQPRDRWFFRPKSESQSMLLVSQTAAQRRMLQLYGNKVVGMDATYKTSKWGFPMFMLNIVTNHGHGYPVALFFVEREDGASIAEALQVLANWNPNWQPDYVMVDKSDAEINAMGEVFGEQTKVLLCDFHRLQAWCRWINYSKHGVGAER